MQNNRVHKCREVHKTITCPREKARLQRSAGRVLLSLRSWSSQLFQGRPGRRLQLRGVRKVNHRVSKRIFDDFRGSNDLIMVAIRIVGIFVTTFAIFLNKLIG